MSDDGTLSTIQDARTGRPWWQVCCTGCLLLIVAACVGAWLLFRGTSGPSSMRLNALPDTFPKNIHLYRLDEARSIMFLQGKNSNKLFQAIMAPLHLFAGGAAVTSTVGVTTGTASIQSAVQVLDVYAEKFKDMDSVIVSWDAVSSTRQDVMDFYTSTFVQDGFTSTSTHDAVGGTDVLFATRSDASIQLQIQAALNGQGIEAMVAAVTYTNKP